MKTLIDPEDCAGKVVERVTTYSDNELAVLFTDGTALYVHATGSYGGGGELRTDGEPDGWEARNLGIVSHEEYEVANAEREQRAKAEAERRDRQTLEFLKRKYEQPSSSAQDREKEKER